MIGFTVASKKKEVNLMDKCKNCFGAAADECSGCPYREIKEEQNMSMLGYTMRLPACAVWKAGKEKMTKKYNTCAHVERVGEMAVFVRPGCPRANMIKGILVSSRRRCEECQQWKEKADGSKEVK